MSVLAKAQVKITDMLSKANFSNALKSKKEMLFAVNICIRYFIRSFEEAYLSISNGCQYMAENIQWAVSNPMDFILFMVLYLILVIVIHAFIQSMLRMLGIIKSDDDEISEDDKPKRSRKRSRSFLKPPRKLFVIYEENGEDEEYEVCFESFRKAQKENAFIFENHKTSHSDSTDLSDTEKEVLESSKRSRPKLDFDRL